jgi:hypothetical protein
VADTLTSTRTSSESGAEKRRSSRVPLAVPITVSGIDALGDPFREITTTLSVSCNGCKYRSKNYVQRDSLVTVEIAHANVRVSPRVIQGRARWVQRPRNLREQYEIGLELVVPGNVWGVASPPADWFPHPDDEKLPGAQQGAVRGPGAQTEAKSATSGPAGLAAPADLETHDASAAATDAETTRSLSAFEEIDMAGAIGFVPEELESTPAPVDLKARLQQTIGTSLKVMVDRMAEAAALDIAARITAVIEEVRATCGTTAEEFEGKIRGALDEALSENGFATSTKEETKGDRRRARKKRQGQRQPKRESTSDDLGR